jgi:uncharacterized protein DUF2845
MMRPYIIDFDRKDVIVRTRGIKSWIVRISNDVEGRFREMKITRIICILVVILLLATTSDTMASDFVCGSRIITTGEDKNDVLRKCGEPSNVEVWEELRIIRGLGSGLLVEKPVTIEEWEYNLGPNRFIRYLTFKNCQLINIADGDYGY